MRRSLTRDQASGTREHGRVGGILRPVVSRAFLGASRIFLAVVLAVAFGAVFVAAQTQVRAQIVPGAKPIWEKGIAPITPESYYNAIECGKQGGNPACVFWDTGLCKNPDFELAMYT